MFRAKESMEKEKATKEGAKRPPSKPSEAGSMGKGEAQAQSSVAALRQRELVRWCFDADALSGLTPPKQGHNRTGRVHTDFAEVPAGWFMSASLVHRAK